MAAGKGTRLKSKRPKVLHEVGGRALLLHVIAAARTLVRAEDIYCIVGHEAERVRAAVASTGVNFVLQEAQLGTGHAMQVLKAYLQLPGNRAPKHLLVLSVDVPLIRPETLTSLCELHLRERAAMTILTAIPPDPTGYGRIVRSSTQPLEVTAIVEQKALTPAHGGAPEINSGIYCFETEALFSKLSQLSTHNAHGEFYLTDVAAMLVADHRRVIALKADSVTVRNGCILDGAQVGDGAILGPYAHLRPDSNIGADAHVGNFCETKKVTLGRGSKANHLTYLGDAIIGAGTNIGAGVITCNYDGVHKHTTTIGNGVFVGSDSTLVAPITIGDGAYVGAGSCITHPVPADALALGRAQQTTKEGWATRRRVTRGGPKKP